MSNLDPNKKSPQPWGGFGTLIIIVLALLVAWFIVLPLGQEVRHIFQRTGDLFSQ